MKQSDVVRTRIIRIGNALGVRLGKAVLRQIGLSTRLLQAGELGPEVELKVEGGSIVITPYKGSEPSFEERAGPPIEKVSVAPPHAQDLVLQAMSITVEWLDRAKVARARLAAVVREVYLYHQVDIQEAKEQGVQIWRRADLVWFLLVHRVVTSQTQLVLNGDLSYERISDAQLDRDALVQLVLNALGARGGLVISAQARAEALVQCYERIEQEGGLEEVNSRFRLLPDKRAMRRFINSFKTTEIQYTFRITRVYDPLVDLYAPSLANRLEVTQEMKELLHRLQLYPAPVDTPQRSAHSVALSTISGGTTPTVSARADADVDVDVDAHVGSRSGTGTLGAPGPATGTQRGTGPVTPDTPVTAVFSGSHITVYEQFYLQVAEQAGIEAWELEHVMRMYFDEVLRAVEKVDEEQR